MGNVKLDEDSREINTDRMYFYEKKGKELEIFEPEETLDSLEKSEKISEKKSRVDIVKNMAPISDDDKKQETKTSKKSNSISASKKSKEYEDKVMYCKVCGKQFTFSKNEQKEYDKNGWRYPNRCPKCERRKYLPTWIKI